MKLVYAIIWGSSLFLMSVAIAAPASAQITYVPVALAGQSAPGVAGATFSDLHPYPTSGPTGEVGFLATIAGAGVGQTNDRSYYQGLPGSLALVAREGDPAPGASGRVFGGGFPIVPGDLTTFEHLRVLPGGAGALIAHTIPPGQGDAEELALYALPPVAGPPRLVTREGHPAPGTTQAFENVSFGRVNNAGDIAFSGDLAGGGSGIFLFNRAAGSLNPVAVTGQAALGAGLGATFANLDSPSVNSASRVAFGATLSGVGGGPLGYAVYEGAPDAPALVARTGDAAPGAAGATIQGVFGPVISDSGLVAFGAQLGGPGIGAAEANAVYFGTPGAPQLVARGGMAVPGTDQVVGGTSVPAVNSAGQFAFGGSVRGPSPGTPGGEAILTGSLHDGGTPTLQVLARDGDAVPGLPGYTFQNPGSDDQTFGNPTINALGQVAFGAVMDDGTGAEIEGLFATDPTGDLWVVARQGQQILIAPGDLRTISGLWLVNYGQSAGEGGMPLNFNDAGQLAFHAYFTDGSQGIIVATVPEPSSAWALVVIGMLLLCRGRRPTAALVRA